MKKILYILLLLPLLTWGQKTMVWDTDFETDQWNVNSSSQDIWEYKDDMPAPRTTDHASAAISVGRDGVNRAVWLGDWNNHPTRSELFADRFLRTDQPTYVGWAMYIDESPPGSRTLAQFRNMKASSDPPTTTAAKNPITIRRHPSEPDRLVAYLYTDASIAETVPQANGASPGAEQWPKNHSDGGVGFDYAEDTWIDIVMYWSALSYTSGNTFKMWVDGDLIINHTGVTNLRYMPTGLEISGDLKHNIGPYWASTNSPQGNVYYDDYKACEGAGCTYEDVSPLGSSPNGSSSPSITSANVYPTSDKLLAAGTRQLYRFAVPETSSDQTGTWSTSDAAVATVSSSGLVTAVATGTCTITWTANDTTNGTITDTSAITVESSSTEDSIMILQPQGYYTPTSGDADSWDDTSGFDLHGTEVGTVTFTDEASFDGSSYYELPDSEFLDYVPSTDEFTIIYREGDTAPTTRGYALAKRGGTGEQQWASPAYNGGNLQNYYLGGQTETAASVELNDNRLVIMVVQTSQVDVWVDGVHVIDNSSSIGTETFIGPANIGGRTNGSYLMNSGGTLDIVATVPKAISTAEREAVETEFIVNTQTATVDNSTKPLSVKDSPIYFLGTTKKFLTQN